MVTFTVEKRFERDVILKENSASLCRMFGVTAERVRSDCIVHKCSVNVEPGDIVYITGPSGAGKSVLLRLIEEKIEPSERINLSQIALCKDKAAVDCIEENVIAAMRKLCTAGLSDVFCVLNQPANLSDGQKWRFRLAMAIAKRKKYIFADEFCSNLDRITALAISYNIRRYAAESKTVFILASSHDDILMDLQPDIIVFKELSGEARVIYKELLRQTNGND